VKRIAVYIGSTERLTLFCVFHVDNPDYINRMVARAIENGYSVFLRRDCGEPPAVLLLSVEEGGGL